MNKKGQALVEFVLILPVFLFLIFIVYDFGMIYNKKNALENKSSDIISLYKSGKTISEIKNIYQDLDISINLDNDYYKISVIDSVKIITPGLNRILGNPYKIEVERYIPNEQ